MKHELQRIIEDGEFNCRSYSGRGMYGKSCLGVEIDLNHDSSLGSLMASIVYLTTEDCQEEVAEGLKRLRMDSLGLGQIVYFPGIPYSEDEPESDESEEENEED